MVISKIQCTPCWDQYDGSKLSFVLVALFMTLNKLYTLGGMHFSFHNPTSKSSFYTKDLVPLPISLEQRFNLYNRYINLPGDQNSSFRGQISAAHKMICIGYSDVLSVNMNFVSGQKRRKISKKIQNHRQ